MDGNQRSLIARREWKLDVAFIFEVSILADGKKERQPIYEQTQD